MADESDFTQAMRSAAANAREAAQSATTRAGRLGHRASRAAQRSVSKMRANYGVGEQADQHSYVAAPSYEDHAPDSVVCSAGHSHDAILGATQEMCAAAAAAHSRVRDSIESASPWASEYRTAFASLTAIDAPHVGVRAAESGLEYVGDAFRLGSGLSLGEATIAHATIDLDQVREQAIEIAGDGARPSEFFLNLAGERQSGQALRGYLDLMYAEHACQEAALKAGYDLVEHPEWLEALDELTFVVLGAGSDTSPSRQLLEWGARVVAIDFPQAPGMASLMQDAVTSAGTLIIPPAPLRDVVANPLGIAAWVATLEGRIVLVDSLFLSGASSVIAAVAADLVESAVCAARPEAALAWIGTPLDAWMLPEGTPLREHLGAGAPAQAIEAFARTRGSAPSRSRGVFNGITDFRGPAAMAAKRIGRWRATVERYGGRDVSYTITPFVLSHRASQPRTTRMLQLGMKRIGLDPGDARGGASAGAGLVLWDLMNPRAVASDDYFMVRKAIDGGVFALPFEPNDLLSMAVALGASPWGLPVGRARRAAR